MSEEPANPDEQAAAAEFDAQAAQAAGRIVSNNPEYLDHHPDAIEDPKKAEFVAHATKSGEEDVIRYANNAKTYISGESEHNLDHDQLIHQAEVSADAAISSRKRTDEIANKAAEIYDKAEATKTGKLPPEDPANLN